ncbi:MAG: hypothetical protein PHO71_22170 [Bacteroides sp.]|nr:hypothetical protein [Bacteroides sp.]
MRGRYVDDFLGLKCAGDILNVHTKIFPNVKEISESQAAYFAIVNHLDISPSDENVVLICPGDGKYSRTSILCAFRTKWTCINIDPEADTTLMDKVDRLTILNTKVQDLDLRFQEPTKLVIAAVHSHAPVLEIIKHLKCDGRRAMVAIPCCVSYRVPPYLPEFTYIDPYILSPKNDVLLWSDLK